MQKNGLIRKKADFKLHVITAWLTNNCHTHIANISGSKDNQTMKFSQLIECNMTMKFSQLTECNMRNTFLKKPYTKCSGETIARPFSKKSKFSISLNWQCNILYSLFFLYAKLSVIKIY